MRDPKADRIRLLHILEAIGHIEGQAGNIREDTLDRDAMLRFSVVKLIEIIGEAANMLTKELRENNPQVPWPRIIGMRHRLVHDYFNVDTTVVAEVVNIHLPQLKAQLEEILGALPNSED